LLVLTIGKTEGERRSPSVARTLPMPTYLVEAYMPRSHTQEAWAAGRRARAAADDLSREGTAIRYVRTTFLPDDETCFHLFEAGSANAVEEVSRRAELGRARVVRAIEASLPGHRRAR
jgi:hypothetical protein